jgi:outer membrane protein OmpA-like peptidoglycan-associated protein
MPSLLDSVAGLLSPQLVSQVADRLGEPATNVSRGLQTSVTALLAALAARADDGGLMRNVSDMASRFSSDPSAISPATLLDPSTTAPDSPASTAGLLSSVLGGGAVDTVGDAIARFAGLRDDSARSLLGMAMPLALSVLGRQARDEGLDESGVAGVLRTQRGTLLAALPPGIGAALGGTKGFAGDTEAAAAAWAARLAGEPGAADETRRPILGPVLERAERRAARRRRLIPIMLTLVVLGLVAFWAVRNRMYQPTVAASGLKTGTAAGAVGAPVGDSAGPGGMVRVTLPGGVAMEVAPTSIEARLIRFIQDSSAMVNDTTWFDFDRLLFETGSATLTPDSEEQLRFVAQILKAYPNVRARIGGYTDNSGDASANVKLSQARAETVMKELVGQGIAANRLDARGYGAEHPVADNSTEEGRARNRRISLLVTAK